MPTRGMSEKNLRDNGARETTLVGYAPAPVPVLASVPLGPAAPPADPFEPTIWATLPAVADEALAAQDPSNAPTDATVSRAKASGRPDRRNPLSRRQPINRGRHLSRQFFEEGERHQRTGWQTAQLPIDDEPVDRSLHFQSFDRVPSRRAPGIALTLLAGIAVIGLAAWGMGWPNFSTVRPAPVETTQRTEVAPLVAPVELDEVPTPSREMIPVPITDTEVLSVEDQPKPTAAPGATRAARVPARSVKTSAGPGRRSNIVAARGVQHRKVGKPQTARAVPAARSRPAQGQSTATGSIPRDTAQMMVPTSEGALALEATSAGATIDSPEATDGAPSALSTAPLPARNPELAPPTLTVPDGEPRTE